jgi:hypothetical protein
MFFLQSVASEVRDRIHPYPSRGIEIKAEFCEDAGAVWGERNSCSDFMEKTGDFEDLVSVNYDRLMGMGRMDIVQ